MFFDISQVFTLKIQQRNLPRQDERICSVFSFYEKKSTFIKYAHYILVIHLCASAFSTLSVITTKLNQITFYLSATSFLFLQ